LNYCWRVARPGGKELRKLGLTATIIVRIIGNLLALLINIAAAFVLVRRLGVSDYAFYQTLTKRGTWLGSFTVILIGDWVYRYNAQRVPGSWEAGVIATLLSSVYAFSIGILLALYLGSSTPLALLSGVAVALLIAYAMTRRMLNALRPVRFAALPIIYRLIYTGLVVLLVYFTSYGVMGALWSIVVAGTVAVALALFWTRSARPSPNNPLHIVKEWVKHSYVYVPLAISSLLMSLDALIVYHFQGDRVVAAFFATFMIFSLILESISTGIGYITTYLLQGGEEERTHHGLVILLALITPLLVFIAAYPTHIMYLVNPRYLWASRVLVFHTILAITSLFETYIGSIASGTIRGLASETATKLAKLAFISLISKLTYFIEILLLLQIISDNVHALIAWSLSLTSASLIAILGYLYITPSLHPRILKRHITYLAIYIMISIFVAHLVSIPPPSPQFFTEIKIVLPPFIGYALITYSIIIFITPEIRRIIRQILGLLHLTQ